MLLVAENIPRVIPNLDVHHKQMTRVQSFIAINELTDGFLITHSHCLVTFAA